MLMPRRYNRRRRIAFASTGEPPTIDFQFPRAVAGEDYERYARSMWRQADRWFQQHAWMAASVAEMQEAREIMWAVANASIGRALYPQEERLLSELLHAHWDLLSRREQDPDALAS
jgi:hypothetical protein